MINLVPLDQFLVAEEKKCNLVPERILDHIDASGDDYLLGKLFVLSIEGSESVTHELIVIRKIDKYESKRYCRSVQERNKK